MIFLEIAMIIIGLGAVIYSIRISETSKKDLVVHDETNDVVNHEERENERLQNLLDSFTQKAETVCDDLDDRMSQMSTEKIMGMSEYSDQVLEKIEKNHEEVVFLYDMMNEKQEELKRLVHDVDSMKADLHDEAAREYQKMKEQEQQFDEMKKSMELDLLQFQAEQSKFRQEFEQLKDNKNSSAEKHSEEELNRAFDAALNDNNFDSMEDFEELLGQESFSTKKEQETAEDVQEIADAVSVYDAEIARIEEEEAKAVREKSQESNLVEGKDFPFEEEQSFVNDQYHPISEQGEIVNHNDEIISLYKKGRSILEISKMLSLGQGEVKFVIDLYNAR